MSGPREEFYRRHEGETKSIVIGGWVLFEDGAQMEVSSYGVLMDPSADRRERLGVQERYHEELLRRATEQFTDLKNHLQIQAKEAIKWAGANTPPFPPSNEDVARLRAYQARVQECQRHLEIIRNELEDAKPDFMKQREEIAAANLERNTAALEAIKAIQI